MIKQAFLKDILFGAENSEDKEELNEAKKKKKADRCIRIAKRKFRRWPSAYACVPESSSKALTMEGWKSVEELSIGEEILTFNMDKDILEFKPIQAIHRYKNAKTNVIRSGNTGFIFEATENHKWVVKLPDTISDMQRKYIRNHNNFYLIETRDLLKNKNSKSLVVSAPYFGGNKIIKDKIYKYGDNWISYLLESSYEQRQSWLFSAIIYDGNQRKTQRLTENINHSSLEWEYDGNYGKQSFGFKQKDIMHRDAFLLSAFLNEGLVTWKKVKGREIYNCNYIANKKYKSTHNFRLVEENITDVWCPETENSTWVMRQEINGQGIITITGNSGLVVQCRQGRVWRKLKEEYVDAYSGMDEEYVNAYNGMNEEDILGEQEGDEASIDISDEEFEEMLREILDEGKRFKAEKEKGLHGWFSRNRGKGWVDCRTGKPCGRQEGEKRKYPACRPTKAMCNRVGPRRKKGRKTISWVPKSEQK